VTAHKHSLELDVPRDRLPRHVAIIMDGNGRWAKKRGLPRIAGHHEGVKTARAIVRAICEPSSVWVRRLR